MSLLRPLALAWLVAGLIAGCGSGSSGSASNLHSNTAPVATTAPGGAHGAPAATAFAWLRPGLSPPGWSVAHLSDGAVLAYPSSWRRIRSDPQTVSAAREDSRTGLVEEYLNVTPQQGDETLRNWSTFRPGHNGEEGDSHIQVIAAARGLRFRDGHGSCVIDRYATSRTTYQEIACLARGPHGGNVIVAAAQAARWAESAPVLEQAVSAFLG